MTKLELIKKEEAKIKAYKARIKNGIGKRDTSIMLINLANAEINRLLAL